jgi:hypothetical protein
MKALQTLIKIHQENPSKMLELWKKENKSGKMMLLYEQIAVNSFANDMQASIFFYKTANHSNYRRLKHALKQKLIELLQFVPIGNFQRPSIKSAFKLFVLSVLEDKSVDMAVVKEIEEYI